MTSLTPRLARDQATLIRRADQAADVVERVVRSVWSELLAILQQPGMHWHAVFDAVRKALDKLRHIDRELAADLLDAGKFARETTERHIETIGALPVEPRGGFDGSLPRHAFESRQLVEDFTFEPITLDNIGDLFQVFRGRQVQIFKPLDLGNLTKIIYSTDWRQRLAAQTKLANPAAIASIITQGFALGKTPARIAREIRPAVQGVQSTARRIARTEGLRIAHEVQLDTYEQIPGVIAYQIHSMHFPATRHWHAQRDKTIYYRNPGPGQKGFFQLPRPPMEAPDVNERPRGTPQIAFNCLCWITPVFES
jgi:hypothetical protein